MNHKFCSYYFGENSKAVHSLNHPYFELLVCFFVFTADGTGQFYALYALYGGKVDRLMSLTCPLHFTDFLSVRRKPRTLTLFQDLIMAFYIWLYSSYLFPPPHPTIHQYWRGHSVYLFWCFPWLQILEVIPPA